MSMILSEDCLSSATDSILVRKSRLRRIISGGKLHSTGELPDFKDQVKEEKEKTGVDVRGAGDGENKRSTLTFSCPVSTWNLDEECLLDAFLVLFDEVEQHTNKDTNARFFISKFEPVVQRVKKMRVNMNDFEIGKLISKGSFSSLHVVRETSNGRIYAMKSINKFHPNVEQRLYLRDAELTVLSKHASQWIVGFNYAFQDDEQIHYVLEYMSGGNYSELLQRHGGTLNEEVARFYLAELILAVNAVHELGFAHRNVRPENILFDSLGHLKLSGFGSASRITKMGKVSTPLTVDEASYEAPEILRTLGNHEFIYGVECDFWSVGVIAYETVFGRHPFKETNPLSTFKKITLPKTKESLKFPQKLKFPNDLRNLLSGLLVEQEERLDYKTILAHPFFSSLIWDGIRNEIALSIPPGSVEDMFACGGNNGNVQTPRKAPIIRPLSNVSFIGFTVSPLEDQRFTGCTLDQSSVLDSSAGIDDGCTFNSTNKDYVRLKSELEVQTETYKEKLNEIQILQTQLQESHEVLQGKDVELASLQGENKKLSLDVDQLRAALKEERDSREQIEFRIQETKMNCSITEMNELKEEIRCLNQALSSKDTEVHDLTAQVKELQKKVKDNESERHNSMKREEALEESFAQTYRGSMSMIETRVTRNSSALEAKIRDLENQVCQMRQKQKAETEKREAEVRDLLQAKSDQIAELQGRMEETRLSREAGLEEIRLTRKKYGETIGQLQTSLDRAIEDYLEMKDKFEKEHDPTFQLKVESLEKDVEELRKENADLKLQLNECEQTKVAEASKAQQLDDIVKQLSESVNSLQSQKMEIFESTKEFLRQNQNSESLKCAQQLLEDQLTKVQETLDATKEALFQEKQNSKELTATVKSCENQIKDYQKVTRVLTEDKNELEDKLKKLADKCKQTELSLANLETEMKELKRAHSKQSATIGKLEGEVAEERKYLEETKKLLAETKAEKERLEKEKSELVKEVQEMVQLKSQISELESEMKQKDIENEAKLQEIEASNLKMDILKESCTMLDNQLKRLETILANKNAELETAIQAKTSLSEKLKATEESLKEAKIAVSEAKSLQIFAERQLASVKAQTESEVQSKTELVSQLHEKAEELRMKYDEKLGELNTLAGKLEQVKQEKTFLDTMHEQLKRKQDSQCHEISRYLNTIVNMKEQMINLKTDMHEERQKAEFYRDRAKILIEEKELVEMDKVQREGELQATINQQVKLIQFFQSQAQQLSAKKKKFRFFGREKGTELPKLPEELLPPGSSGALTLPAPRTPATPASTPGGSNLVGFSRIDPKNVRKFQFEDDMSEDEERDGDSVTNTSTSISTTSSS